MPTAKNARSARVVVYYKEKLWVSPVVVSGGVGVGEVDETHVDGTRGCDGAIAMQK